MYLERFHVELVSRKPLCHERNLTVINYIEIFAHLNSGWVWLGGDW
jgi:hypothetical protein